MRMSFIPLLVTNDEYLQKATTMTSLVWSVMAAFGAGIGGIVSAYVGVQACFLCQTAFSQNVRRKQISDMISRFGP